MGGTRRTNGNTGTASISEAVSEKSNVEHPDNYQGKYECIDEMLSLFGVEVVRHFCMCNVYKYRFRADRKNGAEDIAKAEWYMSKLMELDNLDVSAFKYNGGEKKVDKN